MTAEQERLRCSLCKVAWGPQHLVAWDDLKKDGRIFGYTKLPDGRLACNACIRCRACQKILENPSRRDAHFNGSLVARCNTCHQKAAALRHTLIRKRSFSENNVPGKSLKSLLGLGRRDFKKMGGAVLRSVDGEREAEVMFFHDMASHCLVRMTQFSKATRVGRRGKLVRAFDRRMAVVIPFHQEFNTDLYTVVRGAYLERLIDALRGRDYRVIEKINLRGKHDWRMPHEQRQTKRESMAAKSKAELDRHLGDTHHDTLREIDLRHREKQRRIGWVEEQ